MVSTAKIIAMFVPIIFSFVLFIGLILFYRKRTGVSAKPVILGAVGFIVFTQVLEKILHVVVITSFPNYADHPLAWGTYGALAAGLFEELGRFILFTWLLKKFHDYKGGISFGIGWGGIEAILLMLVVCGQALVFSFMLNAGTFESSMVQLPSDQVAAIKEGILSQGIDFYYFAILERFLAVFMQMAFSLLVLLGVTKKKFSYVILAVLIHAGVDFPIIFAQVGKITNLWIIEGYLAVIAVFSIIFIKKSKTMFTDDAK
ncbi:YhfC family intramembrane metalloprotease [Neobacillus rhizophilus]|uniref:YhfC family intramembrane metalloprotease n=1 Tax=Neobacillus rhizophilus TaxID=2833579 RepID=A0A942UC03_9BACI|nr:YhfC family glutamic-type intramembrane protease [Neobacillus rhizophilus]MBS4216278.1 YhfC family intramembrane metalloprotease [Neobacillus rhizophilus]